MTGPLDGLRVLVPRPVAGQSTAAEALRAAGAEPVVVPLIQTVPPHDPAPLDDALRALAADAYSWLVLTSAAAVPALLNPPPPVPGAPTCACAVGDGAGAVRVAAVGPGTARAAEAAGIQVDLVPEGVSTAANLVAQFPAPTPDAGEGARRVLFLKGELAGTGVAVGLRDKGWVVDEVVAYRTIPAPPPADDVRADWRSGAIGAAILTSASTVRALVEHLGRPPAGTTLVGIGPSTKAEAERLGLPLAGVAREQTMTGLVDALVCLAATSGGTLVETPQEER